MNSVILDDYINAINIAETTHAISSAIQNANNTAFEKAQSFENAEGFMHNETLPYTEILNRIDRCTSEYEKKELLFFSYYLTQGITWSSLAQEKQRIIELISIGLNRDLL